MSPTQQIGNGRISNKQMREAIQQSGYLLEQRVEPIIDKSGYYVETNPVFYDQETNKSREIDIRALAAIEIYRKETGFIFPMLLCECENNSQPVVFFTKKSPVSYGYCEDLRVSGIPAQFWDKDGFISLAEFTGMDKFQHYCEGEIATQYCNFQLKKKDRSSWIASHNEEQHDTLNKLIKAVDYAVDEDFKNWALPEKGEEERVNIQIYYPVLILQGDLYSAYLKNNRLILRKAKHVQFRKELYSTQKNEIETYQIDVIVENYLPRYLEMIESEVEKIKRVFQRKKSIVFDSIEKIVEEARGAKGEPESYRKYLEF
jgi:hypothetical protein